MSNAKVTVNEVDDETGVAIIRGRPNAIDAAKVNILIKFKNTCLEIKVFSGVVEE